MKERVFNSFSPPDALSFAEKLVGDIYNKLAVVFQIAWHIDLDWQGSILLTKLDI